MILNRAYYLPFIFLALAALITSHLYSYNILSTIQSEPEFEKTEPLNPKLYEIFSFGQLPAFVDSLFLRILQDPSIKHVTPGTHAEIYYVLQLATELDPFYYDAYVFGANLLSVVRDDGPGARDLLLKAERFSKSNLMDYPEKARENYWTAEWRVPFLLGYVFLFDLNDLPSSAREFALASKFKGVPDFVGRLSKTLDSREGQFQAGLKLLTHLMAGTHDSLEMQKLQQKKYALEVSYALFQVRGKFDDYVASKKKTKLNREALWRDFKLAAGDQDPWGGHLDMDTTGRIVTSTPHQNVFGLD